MILRRALYYALMPMAVVLPLWLLITRGIVADDSGWMFVVFLITSPILFVLLAIQAGLVLARKQVRSEKAVSWIDVGFLLAIWVSLVLYGVFAILPIAVISAIAIGATFWVVTVELIQETRARVKGYVDDMAFTSAQRPTRRAVQTPGDAGRIIVVPPDAIEDKSQN